MNVEHNRNNKGELPTAPTPGYAGEKRKMDPNGRESDRGLGLSILTLSIPLKDLQLARGL